jgi:N-methylhydantoinase A
VPPKTLRARDANAIAAQFHAEHNRLYGYSLESEGAAVEIINVRVQAVGTTDRPRYAESPHAGSDASAALKGRRSAYSPEDNAFRTMPVYDGHALRHGHRIAGPAVVEKVTTAIFVSAGYDAACDRYGSLVLHAKGREDLVSVATEEAVA